MNSIRRHLPACLLALILLPVSAQAGVAGRVLYSYGEVSVLRGGAVIGLAPGAPVEEGDVLRTGVFSILQARMLDGALIALKSNSEFKIETYQSAPSPLLVGSSAAPAGSNTGRVLLRLVRGGFRTITGLIGKSSREDYKVVMPVVTIGIRGTDYSLLICEQNCRSAKDGVHARVAAGSISMDTGGETLVLNSGEYAYLGPGMSRPQLRLTPPEELAVEVPAADTAPEEVSYETPLGSQSGGAERSSTSTADSSSVAPGGDTQANAQADSTPVQQAASPSSAAPQPARPAEPAAQLDSGPVQRPIAYNFAGLNLDPGIARAQQESLASSGRYLVPGGSFPTAGYAAEADTVLGSAGELQGLRDSRTGLPVRLGTASVQDQGFDAASGLRWGRWTGGAVLLNGTPLQAGHPETSTLHYVYGPAADMQPVLPRTGSYSYALVGSTSPTDLSGNTGFIGTATLSANFTTQSVSHSLSLGINNTAVSASGNGAISGAGFSGNYDSILVNGLAATAGDGRFSGVFTAATAASGAPAGAALVYGISATGLAPVSGALAFGVPAAAPTH